MAWTVDTCLLIDVAVDDPEFFPASARLLEDKQSDHEAPDCGYFNRRVCFASPGFADAQRCGFPSVVSKINHRYTVIFSR